jgi:two-component system, OmpR family, sensor histidine kinase KdpD
VSTIREARYAGLRRYSTPSLEAVEQRRTQLWAVALVVMGGLAIGMALLSVAESVIGPQSLVSPRLVRLGLIGVTLAFSVYALEKEVHLRRLTRMLVDERVLSTALTNRLNEVSLLSAAGKAVNSTLQREETLDIILSSALQLLDAESGSVLLLEGTNELEVVSAKGYERGVAPGARIPVGDGAAGASALRREPLLSTDDADTAGGDAGAVMAVPLEHRGSLLGVLVVRARPGLEFGSYDVRVLTLFAEHAAAAVANASRYELERKHVSELVELNRMRSSFVAMVSHELRSPLASIIGAVKTLGRHDIAPEHTSQFLDMIERQAERLSRLVEDVLELKKAEVPGLVEARPVDVVGVAREVSQLSRAAGRPVELRASGMALANADPSALEQVLINLVDNAFLHGWGAVEMEVAREGATVRVSVLDRGAGVPADQVEHVFDPFARGRDTGGRGSGLGLYLVRTLTEALGGNVSVSQRPGGGADFTVRLPALEPVPAGAAVAT